MGRYYFSIVAILLTSPPVFNKLAAIIADTTIAYTKPVEVTWDMLEKVTLVPKYSEVYKMKINVPKFDNTLQQLNRKEVIIYGYVIPTSVDGSSFLLSRFPYSSCYFCGNGGVETVMTIKYKGKPPRYDTDDFLAFKGVFELNSTDINELIYILNNATEVKQ